MTSAATVLRQPAYVEAEAWANEAGMPFQPSKSEVILMHFQRAGATVPTVVTVVALHAAGPWASGSAGARGSARVYLPAGPR